MARKLKLLKTTKPKRKRRVINVGDSASQDLLKDKQERNAERLVQTCPRYAAIIASIKEGVPLSKIAKWVVENKWTDVSERSFLNALVIFRRRNSHIINETDIESLNFRADGNMPDVEVMTELNRLLRVQKQRIAIDVTTEHNLGKLFNTTHKEFQVAAEILELMLKAQGRIGGSNNGEFAEDLPVDVREKLRNIRLDEEKRQKVFALTQEYAKRVVNAQNTSSTSTSSS